MTLIEWLKRLLGDGRPGVAAQAYVESSRQILLELGERLTHLEGAMARVEDRIETIHALLRSRQAPLPAEKSA